MGEIVGKGWKKPMKKIKVSVNGDYIYLDEGTDVFEHKGKNYKVVAKRPEFRKGYPNEPDFVIYTWHKDFTEEKKK